VSPHHDDVVISVGASICGFVRRGVNVRVITCFGRSCYAPESSAHGDVELVSTIRAQEDERAISVLGIKYEDCLTLPFPDAQARGVPECDNLWSEYSFKRGGQEYTIRISDQLNNFCGFSDMIIPLAARDTHVDHRIAALAVQLGMRRRIVGCYADLPYALGVLPEEVSARLSGMEELCSDRFERVHIESREGLARKYIAMRAYSSQFSQEYLRGMKRLLRLRGGEDLWLTQTYRSERNI
jgi:LmbE family N-acetylglucosaminyl deacetylase